MQLVRRRFFVLLPGGDELTKSERKSSECGYGEYAAWRNARKHYWALNDQGQIYWPGSSYITPMMPLDSADWPAGIPNATFGLWEGDKIGRLCAASGARGIFAADFVEGLRDHGCNLDFNPRVINAFEKWAKVSVPGSTIKERADYIRKNYWVEWHDYICDAYAQFYAMIGQRVKESGKEPFLAAQTHFEPAFRRWLGTDYRIYTKYFPGKNWYFQIELQSDGMRSVPVMGYTHTKMGLFACYEPDIVLGSHIDCDMHLFWRACQKGQEWCHKYLKHHYLTVGWVHIATRQGDARRSTGGFYRHEWDGGQVDPVLIGLLRKHIPKRPFGPACYYSLAIAKDFERRSGGDMNKVWKAHEKFTALSVKGVPTGYYVSDVAIDNLKAENYPSAWIVPDKELLPANEKQRLESIAPIYSDTEVSAIKDKSPVSTKEPLINFAFFDQNGDMVILVANPSEQSSALTLVFKDVKDGSYNMSGLLDNSTAVVEIKNNTGSYTTQIGNRDSKVFLLKGGLDYAIAKQPVSSLTSRISNKSYPVKTKTLLFTLQGAIVKNDISLSKSNSFTTPAKRIRCLYAGNDCRLLLQAPQQ